MPNTFGAALQALRAKQQLSQSAFAELVDCDHSYVSRMESGVRVPTREFIERLCLDLELPEVDCDTLLVAAGYLPPQLEDVMDDPEALEVLRLLVDPATPESVRELVRQAARVAKEVAA